MPAASEPSFVSAIKNSPCTSGAEAIQNCLTGLRQITVRRERVSLHQNSSTNRFAPVQLFSKWSIGCLVTPQYSHPSTKAEMQPNAGRAFGKNTNPLTIEPRKRATRCTFRWMTRMTAGGWWHSYWKNFSRSKIDLSVLSSCRPTRTQANWSTTLEVLDWACRLLASRPRIPVRITRLALRCFRFSVRRRIQRIASASGICGSPPWPSFCRRTKTNGNRHCGRCSVMCIGVGSRRSPENGLIGSRRNWTGLGAGGRSCFSSWLGSSIKGGVATSMPFCVSFPRRKSLRQQELAWCR